MNTYVIFGASGDMGISYIKHLDSTDPESTVIGFANNSIERLLSLQCKSLTLVPVKCDLSDDAETDKALAQITERYSNITHFISFAYGRLKYDRVTNFSSRDIEKAFRIQISACGIALSHIIPQMKKHRSGRIIIMTSSAAVGAPPAFMSEYTILKYAAVGMIKSYAAECVKFGITVNGVAPSMAETRLWKDTPSMLAEMIVNGHPMKRAVTFPEISRCIDFLASPDAGFITGENIDLSGGETLQ
ncbi:MAG TPA: hypothetical protein DCZ62_04720 [Ruminococcus sp.]|nr:hypothetical protein [Ruminococcus sp.]